MGIRSWAKFSTACMAVLAVDLLKGRKTWCSWVKNIFYRKKSTIQYHKSSLIWRGIRHGLQQTSLYISWIIGRRSSLSMWMDSWLEGQSLSLILQIPQNLEYTQNSSIGYFIQYGVWNLLEQLKDQNEVYQKILEVQISEKYDDQLVWLGNANGEISVKVAYLYYRDKNAEVRWFRKF